MLRHALAADAGLRENTAQSSYRLEAELSYATN
jgi:hypothetical protein